MEKKALNELFKIIECDQKLEREARFFVWKRKWLEEVKYSQSVINKSTLSSDDHDFICEYLTKSCLDELIEKDCIQFDIDKNKYTAKLHVIKSKPSKK